MDMIGILLTGISVHVVFFPPCYITCCEIDDLSVFDLKYYPSISCCLCIANLLTID